MKRILRIGMGIHSTNYTLCALEPVLRADDIVYANVKVSPDADNIVQFIENLKAKMKKMDTGTFKMVKEYRIRFNRHRVCGKGKET